MWPPARAAEEEDQLMDLAKLVGRMEWPLGETVVNMLDEIPPYSMGV